MKKKLGVSERQERLWGLVFVGPTIIGLALFFYLSLGASAFISLTDWTALSDPHWVGLANYAKIIHDPLLSKSLVNTLFFVVLEVPISIAASLAFALAINAIPRGRDAYRLVFFLPYLTLPVALAIVWKWMFNKSFGLFNSVLGWLSIPPVDWLGNSHLAMPSIVFYTVMTGLGYGMVIYLAGLKNISKEYYEAATIDGASKWRMTRSITLPLLSPTTFYMVITSLISAFQIFDPIYIMTKGGPANSTRSIMFSVYEEGFRYFRFGTASAIAWILFAIIMAVTIAQLAFQKKWVHYE
jgi:ABC-type sugar transport systems, permease components